MANKDIIEAVRDKMGGAYDNLYRAQIAARRNDPTKQWGESGKTLQQIIDGYQAEYDRWVKALEELGVSA